MKRVNKCDKDNSTFEKGKKVIKYTSLTVLALAVIVNITKDFSIDASAANTQVQSNNPYIVNGTLDMNSIINNMYAKGDELKGEYVVEEQEEEEVEVVPDIQEPVEEVVENLVIEEVQEDIVVPEEVQTGYVDTIFDIKDKDDLVGICYSTWFNPISSTALLTSEPYLEANRFYYWGEPEDGFYRSDDKEVIRKHMMLLEDAGIDFIILDNTNACVSWMYSNYWYDMITSSNTALLDTIYEMNQEGLETPKVVNWINTSSGEDVVMSIYNEFYTNSKYDNEWVYYDGRPFVLTTTYANLSLPLSSRKMWGCQSSLSTSEWCYLDYTNDMPSYDEAGNVEQLSVSVAVQGNFMSNTSSAKGRRDGNTFYEQWQNAFYYRPKVVTLTWWNEWAAQYINGVFTDEYNQEYSRDIEPMKGGHGDLYYEWMCQYIEAYKNHEECPKLIK